MTDIVERLRLAPDADFYRPSKWFELMNEAADEIEQLQAALQEIADSDVHWRAVNIARVALQNKHMGGSL
jgi:hypothetical protein